MICQLRGRIGCSRPCWIILQGFFHDRANKPIKDGSGDWQHDGQYSANQAHEHDGEDYWKDDQCAGDVPDNAAV